uniref:class I SAM-dependent DNA methyltransferase n=1 Tax=Pedobacter schmidteae TaxID=2201271 RepID=UPI000EB37048|nr:class I SAM-dependent methyltransferase [Pedobacter schmidteae]
MGVFNRYSEYYDLLYKDKDYESEVNYIDRLIKKVHPNAKTILDLGCGTGIHAYLLAKKGYVVTGIDFSEEMISIADTKKKTDYKSHSDMLDFHCADIRNIQLEQQFDLVVSLFHVISYINDNRDLQKVFSNVKQHLNPNGVFICDFWYGPGVLSDPPVVRAKRLKNASLDVTRIAEPEIHANLNVVDVNYTLFVNDKLTNETFELTEKHSMRYFFEPELRLFLDAHTFDNVCFYEWLKEEQAELGSWNVCLVAKS